MKPTGVLSPQTHVPILHYWIVVSGSAEAPIDGMGRFLKEDRKQLHPTGHEASDADPGKLLTDLSKFKAGPVLA